MKHLDSSITFDSCLPINVKCVGFKHHGCGKMTKSEIFNVKLYIKLEKKHFLVDKTRIL